MKAIINFLVLFFCININIIFTTCYPYNKWAKNYAFTGISKKCSWYFTTDLTSNLSRGNTIMITNPPAHILHPDSFFGFNSVEPKFNYERVECEFDVKAPVDHGLVVTIQQMYFDKECTDFVQLTNQNGSLNKTICDKFGGFIPRSYPGGNYLGELILNEHNNNSSKWEVVDAEGRIRVKISVTKENFENLRYLFIAFTAIKRDLSSDNKNDNEKFILPLTFYCDGIKNYKKAGDENDCDNKLMDQIIDKIVMTIGISFLILYVFGLIKCMYTSHRKKNAVPVEPSTTTANPVDTPSVNVNTVPVQPSTTAANSVNTPSVNVNKDNDEGPPTYGALFPDNFQQVPSTSRR